MKRPLYIVIITLFAIISCETDEVTIGDLEKAVVQGYLYANGPVDQIKLTRLIPFGASEEELSSVNDLDLSLSSNGTSYALIPSEGDSGYYHYPGNDLQILEGMTYQLEFEYAGQSVRAETTVPTSPVGISLSQDILYREQIVFGNGRPPGGINQNIEIIEVNWENPSGEHHYVVIDNIEENPESILVDLPFTRNFNFVTQPTEGSSYIIQPFILEQFGTHRVIVYKVNQEYADLYVSLEQDSRNLNEPFSNVNNGLGIFTAFNSDTLYFELKKL